MQHVYYKSFKEGGLTFGQIHTLLEAHYKRKHDDLRNAAALKGIKIPEFKKASSSIPHEEDGLFKRPEQYEAMTPEERAEATQDLKDTIMAGPLKVFFPGGLNG